MMASNEQPADLAEGLWAFPWQADPEIQGGVLCRGMTLRDWFAGQALAWLPHVGCGADLDNRDTATAAYQLADAMLAHRATGAA